MVEIRDFLDDRGTNPITEWLKQQSTKFQAKFEARLVWMSTASLPWAGQYVTKLQDVGDVFEIRIKHAGQQYRPLGCWGPGPGQFTLLLGAKEKNNRFVPPEAVETAKVRAKSLLDGRSKSCVHLSVG